MLKYSKIMRLWSTLPALISLVFVPICVPASAEPSTPKSGAQESFEPSRGSALADEVRDPAMPARMDMKWTK